MHTNDKWRQGSVKLALISTFVLSLQNVVSQTSIGTGLTECSDTFSVPAISPTTTVSPVVSLKWLDKDDQKVVAFTKKVGQDVGGFWFSSDGAKTWAEKTAALTDATKGSKEPLEVLGMYVQKAAPNNIVIFGTGTYIWSSKDYGQTFSAKQTPTLWRGSSITMLKVHPWHDDWLLVMVKRPGCQSMDHALEHCPFDLMMTQDMFGELTWTNLTERSGGKIAGFVDVEWAATLCPSRQGCAPGMEKMDENTILATMYAKPDDYDQAWDKDVHFIITTNFFQDFHIRVYCGNMFEVIGSSIYLAVANSCPTDIHGARRSSDQSFNGIVLYTSTDGGTSFTQGCLPVALKQEGYELMSTQDGTGALVIVDYMVNNGFKDVLASSVYSAGPHQAVFSLSLTNVYRAAFGYSSDFTRIDGLPGVYIANQMVARAESSDYYDIEGSFFPLVESRITFSGGGSWRRIPAPKTFNSPKCNRCIGEGDCFLHLRGSSTWDSMASSMPAVYSNAAAPGMIMATGVVASVGSGLDDDALGTCTWLSTDGGVTWRDVAEGSFIYEYADWGSTIVMARHPGLRGLPATEVKFSVDSGNCWHTVPLTAALLVDNIVIEPDGQRPRVVVHGRACDTSLDPKCTVDALLKNRTAAAPGLMYTVDVQEIMGSRMRKCEEADYEQFTVPTSVDDATPACILGKVMSVKRRRPAAACFNGADFVRPLPANTTCSCTLQDVECDYGYMGYGTRCEPIPADRMPACPNVNEGKYAVSSTGLRLVHADVCTGLSSIISDTDGKGNCLTGNCGSSGGGKRRHSPVFVFFMTLLALLLCGALFTAWWLYLASEVQRDMCRDVASTVSSVVVNAYTTLRDRVRGRPSDQHDELAYFQPLAEVPEHEAGLFAYK